MGLKHKAKRQRNGFTLTEVLVATVVLLVCLAAVAQLVPSSILSNSSNRNDSTAMVFAQQELNQFMSQPIRATQYIETLLNVCTAASPCLLGDAAQNGVTVGSPVVIFNNLPAINFAAAPVAGYSFTYRDLNDPAGVAYDVRWAVITRAPGGNILTKRFILGVAKRGGNGFNAPVTLDTMVGPQ